MPFFRYIMLLSLDKKREKTGLSVIITRGNKRSTSEFETYTFSFFFFFFKHANVEKSFWYISNKFQRKIVPRSLVKCASFFLREHFDGCRTLRNSNAVARSAAYVEKQKRVYSKIHFIPPNRAIPRFSRTANNIGDRIVRNKTQKSNRWIRGIHAESSWLVYIIFHCFMEDWR